MADEEKYYTGRPGVPQDVDVLLDIRDQLKKSSEAQEKLTPAQQAAVDSGITAEKVKKLDGLSSVLEWKGTVETVDQLPTVAMAGDTYHVSSDGSERTWDGRAWQELGGTIDMSGKQDKLPDGTAMVSMKADENGDTRPYWTEV